MQMQGHHDHLIPPHPTHPATSLHYVTDYIHVLYMYLYMFSLSLSFIGGSVVFEGHRGPVTSVIH